MTDMNNMLNLTTTRPQTAPAPSANGQKAPTLSDFVGLLLSPEGQTQDTAALQNMPQNLKALAEKIAAALNGDAPVPAAPAAGDAAVATDENANIPAGLTSDLSAMLASLLQNTESAETVAPAAGETALMPEGLDMQALAGMLNGIEPGAAADDSAMLPSADSDTAEAEADTLLMNMMQSRKSAQGDAAAPAPALPADDMTQAPPLNAKQTQAKNNEQAQQAPQQPAAAAAGQQAQQGAAKTDTALQTLLAAMTPASGNINMSEGGFDSMGGGLGGRGFGQGAFTSGDAAFGGMTAAGQTSFSQYMNTGAAAQALPSQTSEMIAVQIQRNAAAKVDTFTLQLDPADLGRMDIELKFNHDGSLKAHLTVERPETLALLQKDAAHLERVLQQSGLNTDGQSLSFDLRQQNGGQEKRSLQTGNDGFTRGSITGAAESNDNATDNTARGYIGPRGVNIMV